MYFKDFSFLNKNFENNNKEVFNVIILNSKSLSKNMEEIIVNFDKIRDKMIITDGAYKFYQQILKNYKIKEYDLIIGDLDSIKCLPKEKIYKDDDQNSNDLEKALEYMINNYKFNKIVIFGGLNTRIDHLLYNYSLLNKYSEYEIYFITENSVATIIKKGKNKIIFSELNENKYLGIIPLYSEVNIKSTKNLDYNMKDTKLSMTGLISSSNSSSNKDFIIETEDNVLYLASLFEDL